MSLKNIFITIGIVVIVAVSVTTFYLFSQKGENISQEQSESLSSSNPAALPTGEESSMIEENVKLIQGVFENITQETISGKTKQEGVRKVDFKNPKGSPIPLSDFKKALNIEIHPKLQGYLNNNYQIFYCPGLGEKKEFGVYLEYNMEKVYRGFTYDVLDIMKDWENTIFPNLHTVLFSDIDFKEDILNQKINFRDGKYRYAELDLHSGEKVSINYNAVEFGIIISTSPSCLDKATEIYEAFD